MMTDLMKGQAVLSSDPNNLHLSLVTPLHLYSAYSMGVGNRGARGAEAPLPHFIVDLTVK